MSLSHPHRHTLAIRTWPNAPWEFCIGAPRLELKLLKPRRKQRRHFVRLFVRSKMSCVCKQVEFASAFRRLKCSHLGFGDSWIFPTTDRQDRCVDPLGYPAQNSVASPALPASRSQLQRSASSALLTRLRSLAAAFAHSHQSTSAHSRQKRLRFLRGAPLQSSPLVSTVGFRVRLRLRAHQGQTSHPQGRPPPQFEHHVAADRAACKYRIRHCEVIHQCQHIHCQLPHA